MSKNNANRGIFFFNYLLELNGAPTFLVFFLYIHDDDIYICGIRKVLKKYKARFFYEIHTEKISTRKYIHYCIRRLLREYMRTVNR